MNEFLSLAGQGAPTWAVVLIALATLLFNYFSNKRKDAKDWRKKEEEIEKSQRDLRDKSLSILIATDTYVSEKYKIKNSIYLKQRAVAAHILHKFINDISSSYEKELLSMGNDPENSELLIQAFDGFLVRLEGELRLNIEEFITSKDFENDSYGETSNSLQLVNNKINLSLDTTFKKKYNKNRFKVNFPEGTPKVSVSDMLNTIYEQTKAIYDEGEGRIRDIKTKYDEAIENLVGAK